MATKSTRNKLLGISPELFWTISSAIVVGAFFLGRSIGLAKFDNDKIEYYNRARILEQQVENLNRELDSITKQDSTKMPPITKMDIFINGRLGQGLNMGINTSGGKTNWVQLANDEMCLSYPEGQAWGTLFITVGKPSPPNRRASKDFSMYNKLLLELKGESGSVVYIGLKDNLDADDGNESTYPVKLTGGWDTWQIDLAKNFRSADLQNLYVVTEFVFSGKPQTVCVRKIQFIQ